MPDPSTGATPLEAAGKALYDLAYFADSPGYYLQNVVELQGKTFGASVRITVSIKREGLTNGEALRVAEDVADACAAADLSKVRWETFEVASNGPVWYGHNDNLPHQAWARAALTAAIEALPESVYWKGWKGSGQFAEVHSPKAALRRALLGDQP